MKVNAEKFIYYAKFICTPHEALIFIQETTLGLIINVQ